MDDKTRCTASTTFRYFLPAGSVLVDAFLDVDIIKSDFDDAEEFVDFIQVNRLPTLLINIMLCSRLHCQEVSNRNYFL